MQPDARPTEPVDRTPAPNDRGAAAVEMALVLPLLLIFIFGIIDFGRMFNKQIALTEAARDAARVASFGGDATARARLIAGEDAEVTVGRCQQDTRQVTVTSEFSFVTPIGLIGGGFDGQVELSGKGVMPCT